MKKLFCLIFTLVFALGIVACNKEEIDKKVPDEIKLTYTVAEDEAGKILKVFNNDELIQTIDYTFADTLDKSVSGISEDYYLKDVTFDGVAELLLPVERPASCIYFNAYVWNSKTEQYEIIESFSSIENPVIDQENKLILSKRTASQITNYRKICFKDGKFECVASLYWQPADLLVDCAEENQDKMYLKEELAGVIKEIYVNKANDISLDTADPQLAEYIADDSYWDITNEKWDSCFVFE